MQEPKPERRAPPNAEPTLCVGIVIPEDRVTELRVGASNGPGIKLQGRDVSEITVRVVADRLEIRSGTEAVVVPELALRSEGELRPQSGIRLFDVVAGRGFHWEKRIVASYPGALKFLPHHGCLIVVNEVPFEQYLQCVVASEMSADCPREFVAAQAIAARSWAWVFLRNKHPDMPYTICNDDCCQRYQGTSFLTTANAWIGRGKYLVAANGTTVPTYYSKSCGGVSELPENVFGFSCPGISSVIDGPDAQGKDFCDLGGSILSRYLGAVDEGGTYHRWKAHLTNSELCALLKEKAGIDWVSSVTGLVPLETGASGRILQLRIDYKLHNGAVGAVTLPDQYEIRRVLHPAFLLSSAFEIRWIEAAERVVELDGKGWGHGVGLCQIGAVNMALQGFSAEQILKHYFPGGFLVEAYE